MLRRFIKDYKNTSDPEVRGRYATVAGGFGISTNLLMGCGKLVLGLVSRSISIMADAVNNLSDCASSCMAIMGMKLSQRKPDNDHPYGHARYEYLFSFAIGLFMLMMGVLFAKESAQKIISPVELSIGSSVYWTLGIAIAVKGMQMYVYNDFGKAINSLALKASATDARNDIVATTGILIAMIVMGVFGINIDGFIGFAISIFVIISSVETIKETIEPIIGIKPTPERVRMIADKLESYPVCLGIHDLVLHNYGVHNDFVTVHVEVDSSKSMLETHDLIDNIEMDFKRDLGISLTVHMDPIVVGNSEFDEIKRLVNEAIHNLDPVLTIHDVRFVEGPTHTNVIFDCVVPPETDIDSQKICEYLKQNIHYHKTLNYVVEIDIPFC